MYRCAIYIYIHIRYPDVLNDWPLNQNAAAATTRYIHKFVMSTRETADPPEAMHHIAAAAAAVRRRRHR